MEEWEVRRSGTEQTNNHSGLTLYQPHILNILSSCLSKAIQYWMPTTVTKLLYPLTG
jgi:hypothetical protein